MMEEERWTALVYVVKKMVDPARVDQGRAALDAVDGISFAEKKLRQVCTILTRNARYQRRFGQFSAPHPEAHLHRQSYPP
jgi:hypothetical protein